MGAGQASGLPRALCFEGGENPVKLGRSAPREREEVRTLHPIVTGR
jgi:hypothetical protein